MIDPDGMYTISGDAAVEFGKYLKEEDQAGEQKEERQGGKGDPGSKKANGSGRDHTANTVIPLKNIKLTPGMLEQVNKIWNGFDLFMRTHGPKQNGGMNATMDKGTGHSLNSDKVAKHNDPIDLTGLPNLASGWSVLTPGTEGPNPFDQVSLLHDAYDGLRSALEGSKKLDPERPSVPTSLYILDNGDTINKVTHDHPGTIIWLNPDGTMTTVPKVPPKNK
jgi:hypothetical protein